MVNLIVSPFKFIWSVIKRFGTPRGLIALFIAFMIVVGWALVGLISGNAWYVATSITVIAFWAAPISPMWGLIIVITLIIQKYILRDSKSISWGTIKYEFQENVVKSFRIIKQSNKQKKGAKRKNGKN